MHLTGTIAYFTLENGNLCFYNIGWTKGKSFINLNSSKTATTWQNVITWSIVTKEQRFHFAFFSIYIWHVNRKFDLILILLNGIMAVSSYKKIYIWYRNNSLFFSTKLQKSVNHNFIFIFILKSSIITLMEKLFMNEIIVSIKYDMCIALRSIS